VLPAVHSELAVQGGMTCDFGPAVLCGVDAVARPHRLCVKALGLEAVAGGRVRVRVRVRVCEVREAALFPTCFPQLCSREVVEFRVFFFSR